MTQKETEQTPANDCESSPQLPIPEAVMAKAVLLYDAMEGSFQMSICMDRETGKPVFKLNGVEQPTDF